MKSTLTALLLLAAVSSTLAAETGPALFKGADLKLGEQLIATHNCAGCHSRHLGGGPADEIYNPKGRINTPAALRGMVDMCANQLNLQMFPEEVTAVAAVLNRDHYRFKH